MRQSLIILIIILAFSCSSTDQKPDCYQILNLDKANWLIDTDSLKTIDQYFDYQKYFWKKEGLDKDLIPQIKVTDKKVLNLTKIRRPLMCCMRKFDFRSVIQIMVFEDRIETLWTKDTVITNEFGSNYFKGQSAVINNDSLQLLASQIEYFFNSNQEMNLLPDTFFDEYGYDIDKLEIRIIFYDKSLKSLPKMMGFISDGYLKFLNKKSINKFGEGLCKTDITHQSLLMKQSPLNIYLGRKFDSLNKSW